MSAGTTRRLVSYDGFGRAGNLLFVMVSLATSVNLIAAARGRLRGAQVAGRHFLELCVDGRHTNAEVNRVVVRATSSERAGIISDDDQLDGAAVARSNPRSAVNSGQPRAELSNHLKEIPR